MRKILKIVAAVIFFLISTPILLSAQLKTVADIPVVDYEGLKPLLEKHNDTIYIVNFWATWCGPCIKELPYFQQIHDKYRDQKIKVILVSLDFYKQIESRLLPFIIKNKVTPQIVLLNDPASNKWIDKIDADWSGGLPATMFYNRDKRLFYEKEFTLEEIEETIRVLQSDTM
jgi:thiol-disulfide isomerase/thioredoxin